MIDVRIEEVDNGYLVMGFDGGEIPSSRHIASDRAKVGRIVVSLMNDAFGSERAPEKKTPIAKPKEKEGE